MAFGLPDSDDVEVVTITVAGGVDTFEIVLKK